MPNITITKCEDITKCEVITLESLWGRWWDQGWVSQKRHCKEFFVVGDVDGVPFAVTVLPSCGEYDYDQYPQNLGEDDEPLQGDIGQYFEDNDINVGLVGR